MPRKSTGLAQLPLPVYAACRKGDDDGEGSHHGANVNFSILVSLSLSLPPTRGIVQVAKAGQQVYPLSQATTEQVTT